MGTALYYSLKEKDKFNFERQKNVMIAYSEYY